MYDDSVNILMKILHYKREIKYLIILWLSLSVAISLIIIIQSNHWAKNWNYIYYKCPALCLFLYQSYDYIYALIFFDIHSID